MSWAKRLTIGLVLLLAACGGSDTVSARQYVAGVCNAAKDLARVIEEQGVELRNLAAESSPEEVKEAIVGFMDEIISETETLISDVDDAGVPDVENGEEIADRVLEGLQKVRTVFEEARADVEELSTDDREEFAQGVQTAFGSLGESSTEVGQSLDELNTEELDQAKEDVEACQSIPEF